MSVARVGTADLARLRLVAHGLPGGSPDPAAAVSRMLAVQAQEAVAPLAAVALRSAGAPPRAAVEAALADGRLVRTWSQRGTLHLVAPEDVPWLLALTGPRMAAAARTVRAREGLSEDDIARTAELVASTMPPSGLRRPALLARFAEAGFGVGGNRGYHLLCALAERGAIVIGARDTQYRFHRGVDRLPAAPPLERDQALARLAARYAAGHGPVSDRDLAGWAGLPLADARRGIAAAGLTAVAHGDAVLWAPASLLDAPLPPLGSMLALPQFDELVIGTTDRAALLGPHPLAAVAPGTNGRFLPVIVLDGRLVATWTAKPTPAVHPLQGLPAEVLRAAEQAAADQAGWSGA